MYKAKTLFSGYKLGLMNADTYVGVPDQSFKGDIAIVKYGSEVRNVNKQMVETTRAFPDKFGRGEYVLNYIKWSKNDQDQSL